MNFYCAKLWDENEIQMKRERDYLVVNDKTTKTIVLFLGRYFEILQVNLKPTHSKADTFIYISFSIFGYGRPTTYPT